MKAIGSFRCSACDRKIPYYSTDRMNAIRRHYKNNHPKKFKEMIEKGVKTRKKAK